jgi:hypothetical protein
MSETKFTPGPWAISIHNSGIDSTGRMMIQCVISAKTGIIVHAVGGINAEADARLIAEAPNMYEALQEIVDTLSPNDFAHWVQTARAALAKAVQP